MQLFEFIKESLILVEGGGWGVRDIRIKEPAFFMQEPIMN
jgi:hypothetical protein